MAQFLDNLKRDRAAMKEKRLAEAQLARMAEDRARAAGIRPGVYVNEALIDPEVMPIVQQNVRNARAGLQAVQDYAAMSHDEATPADFNRAVDAMESRPIRLFVGGKKASGPQAQFGSDKAKISQQRIMQNAGGGETNLLDYAMMSNFETNPHRKRQQKNFLDDLLFKMGLG